MAEESHQGNTTVDVIGNDLTLTLFDRRRSRFLVGIHRSTKKGVFDGVFVCTEVIEVKLLFPGAGSSTKMQHLFHPRRGRRGFVFLHFVEISNHISSIFRCQTTGCECWFISRSVVKTGGE